MLTSGHCRITMPDAIRQLHWRQWGKRHLSNTQSKIEETLPTSNLGKSWDLVYGRIRWKWPRTNTGRQVPIWYQEEWTCPRRPHVRHQPNPVSTGHNVTPIRKALTSYKNPRYWPHTSTNSEKDVPTKHRMKGTNLLTGQTRSKWPQTDLRCKAPTVYRIEQLGYSAELPPHHRHRSNTWINGTDLMPGKQAPTLNFGRKAPSSYWDVRPRPNSGTTGTDLILGWENTSEKHSPLPY